MRGVIDRLMRLNVDRDRVTQEVRNDVPPELRQEMFQELVLIYRELVAPEPPLIHRLDKTIAIGMLEMAIRTGTKVENLLPPR